MTTRYLKYIVAIAIGISLPWSVQAGKFHFPVGLAYAKGINDAADKVFDFYENAGFDVHDRIEVPIGLTFNPYYELDNGIGFGLSLGPTAFIAVREETFFDSHHDDTKLSYIIPIGADVRYTFLRDHDVSPYIRVGVRYPIVGGDNVDSSEPGPFAAIGVELWRTRRIGMGIEVGYDGSEITLKGPDGQKGDVTFAGFTVGLSVLF